MSAFRRGGMPCDLVSFMRPAVRVLNAMKALEHRPKFLLRNTYSSIAHRHAVLSPHSDLISPFTVNLNALETRLRSTKMGSSTAERRRQATARASQAERRLLGRGELGEIGRLIARLNAAGFDRLKSSKVLTGCRSRSALRWPTSNCARSCSVVAGLANTASCDPTGRALDSAQSA